MKNIPKTMEKDALNHLFIAYGEIVDIHIVSKDTFPTNRAYVSVNITSLLFKKINSQILLLLVGGSSDRTTVWLR